MNDAPFRGRAVAAIVVVSVASFVVGLVLSAFGETTRSVSGGADGYSPSAIGHVAFVKLLGEMGVPVVQSRHESARRAAWDGVLVLLEPDVASDPDTRGPALEALLEEAGRVLVVLPKWEGTPGAFAGWADRVDLKVPGDVSGVLAAVGRGTLVRRPRVAGPWSTNVLDVEPTLSRDVVQLVAPGEGRTLVGAADGSLVLERRDADSHVILLADPDVLSNAGLHRGENASFVLTLLDRLRGGEGPVVIDETLHGYANPPTLAREVLSPPLVYALGHGLLCLLVLVATAAFRFGAPARAAPPLEPGTRVLVHTTADLLRAGGHAPLVLPRYLAGVVEEVRAGLHAPPRLEGAALEAWLDRVGEKRAAEERLSDLRAAVRVAVAPPHHGGRVLSVAARVDRWRGQMLSRGTRRATAAPRDRGTNMSGAVETTDARTGG